MHWASKTSNFCIYFRADEAEKKRKDLENATNFNDEHIEKFEADLRLSKKTMRETHEKYDETGINQSSDWYPGPIPSPMGLGDILLLVYFHPIES